MIVVERLQVKRREDRWRHGAAREVRHRRAFGMSNY
ncbi:hypothetical protein JOC37_000322 [Desulfohalotomaculum tongense]|nr:hypothetical protein [Desulforadius tongensis]